MKEDTYRLCLVIILTILVIGFIFMGLRKSENGRYVQFDLQKASRPEGTATVHKYEGQMIDTRTGAILNARYKDRL